MKAVALALLAALVVCGWLRLRIETDILAILPSDLPETRSLRVLRDGFAGGSDLLIAVESEEPSATADAVKTLAARLQSRADLVHHLRWAQSLEDQSQTGPALLAWALQNADPQRLAALRADLEGDNAKRRLESSLDTLANSPDIARVQRVSYDPFGLLDQLDSTATASLQESLFRVTSADGKLGVLFVTPASDVGNYKSATRWLDAIKAEVSAALPASTATVRVTYTGEPAFQSEIGGGIERDMSSTVGFTELLIALLFWFVFRRLKPLLWIQLLLVLSLAIALGLGGLIVGKLSIMSLGFAAIVLGIIVDYAALIIQEARAHPEASASTLRRLAAPGIIAGACTNAVVFLALLLSGLPGLAELGLLVALGILVGLGVMLGLAPPLAAGRQASLPSTPVFESASNMHTTAAWGTIMLIGGIAACFVSRGFPAFETGADALRPTKSAATDVWEHVQEQLGRSGRSSVPLLITAPLDTIRARVAGLEQELAKPSASPDLRFTFPTPLLPDPSAQQANRTYLDWLIQNLPRLEKEAADAGFTDDALTLLRGVTSTWQSALQKGWPQSAADSMAAPLLGSLITTGARALSAGLPENHAACLAAVNLPGTPDHPDPAALSELESLLAGQSGVTVAGWQSLGSALSKVVRRDLTRQLIPIFAVLALTLFFTFRNVRDLALSALLLMTGLAALTATMSALGMSWNLASVAAIPLLLGTGIDYGIHLLLAMEHHGNDIRLTRATTGRAVFFAGMTTIIGFASLCFAGNRGIAGLGLACCLGTAWILLIVLWLLPHWRVWLTKK